MQTLAMRAIGRAFFGLLLLGVASIVAAAELHNLRPDAALLAQLQAGSGNAADRAFLATLGFSPNESLEATRVYDDGRGGTVTRYRQTFRGVPVWGEEIVIGRDAAGRVRSLNGRAVRDLATGLNQVQPALGADEALAAARERVSAGFIGAAPVFSNEKIELVIYVDAAGTPRLSYAVSLFADTVSGGQPTRPTFIADAFTGEVLFSFDGLAHADPDCSNDCTLLNLNDISGGRRQWQYFTVSVPSTVAEGDLLEISISGGSGDADLYTRLGQRPTSGVYDCRPYIGGNNEACWTGARAGDTLHIGIYPFRTYSGVSLVARVKSLNPANSTGPGGNYKTGQYSYNGSNNPPLSYPSLAVGTDASACWMANANVRTVNLNHGTTEAPPFSYGDGSNCSNQHKLINGAYSPLNDAHYFGGVVFDMYQAYLGAAPLTFQLAMRVHYSSNYENAFWDGRSMTFGDGYTTFYPLVALDVAAHEVSHGFTEQNSNLIYSGESGGINEAFSDIAGEAAEHFMRGQNDFDVGREIYKAQNEALRYMCNPPLDGKSAGHVSDYYNGMDVHYSSGIYNKAFCVLAQTSGWTTRTAFESFARANQWCWTASTGFDAGAQCVVDTAADLGYAAQDAADAFAVVGITGLTVPGGSGPVVPAAPTSLTAVAVSESRIDLGWTDNSDNEDGFRIERSPDGTSFAEIATVQANVTGYADTTGLAAGTTYYYQVFAYNAGGSSLAATASATTSGGSGSTIVLSGTGLVRGGKQQVRLSWSGAAGSSVEILRDGVVIAVTANDGAHNDRPSGASSYDYQVCESGGSPCSNTETVTF